MGENSQIIKQELIHYWGTETTRAWRLIQDFENDGYPPDHEVFTKLENQLVKCLKMLRRLDAIEDPELDEVLKCYPDPDAGLKLN